MGILNVPSRLRRGLALSAVAIVSGCLQPLLLVSFAQAARASQRANPASSSDKRDGSRPRRVEDGKPGFAVTEPVIRIGLMTDVNSISLSSPSGLLVRRQTTDPSDADDDQQVAGELRFEVRRLSPAIAETRAAPRPVRASASVYRAEVALVSTPRDARKITDKLGKKFYEPATTVYNDSTGQYRVLIGRFSDRRQANNLVDRLRSAGFTDAIVALDVNTAEQSAAKSLESRNSDPRYRSKPASKSDRSAIRADAQDVKDSPQNKSQQVVAFEADKMITSSEAAIIVVAADSATDRKSATGVSYRAANYEARDAAREDNRAALSERPPLVKVGKTEYRGEIRLMLNERGRINVVNVLPIELYLRGVVPEELPPGAFPAIEALKAQAVAARTYAMSHINRYQKEGFDLRDDARSQVYGGYSAEQHLTNRAIEETRGVLALYEDATGHLAPIEALYTSTCGGRTENSEAIFLTDPVPYLRSVECAPDSPVAISREIKSNWMPEPLTGADGRLLTREVALLEVLGFSLPRRVTKDYLRDSPDRDETRGWIENAARVIGQAKLQLPKTDLSRLPAFASALAVAIYGERRASSLLTPADVDYVMEGIANEDVPRDMRADIALLLKEGLLRLPANDKLSARTTITRGYAIETIARALLLKAPASTSRFQAGLVQSVRDNRVLFSQPGGSKSKTIDDKSEGLEIEKGAWLFRRLGAESYSVDHLKLIGSERVAYHLNANGRIDFLEAELAERGASSDSGSSVSEWRERVSVEDMQKRLARAGVSAGELQDLDPVGYGVSNRVIELNVIGSKGSARLRGYKIRTALGLKENLFVIDRERDDQGRIKAFIFTGRGWGHGVGMCQTGAYGLAKEGYSYRDILQKYYTGIKVQRAY